MTPQARREFLASREFSVARQSFASGGRVICYCRLLLPRTASNPDPYRDHKNEYYLDLATGEWREWHSATWQPWDRGPWHELVEDEPAREAAAPEEPPHSPFVRECLAAGFTYEGPLDNQPGLDWLRRDGQLYVAHSSVRLLVSGERSYRLDEFTRPAASEQPPLAAAASSSPPAITTRQRVPVTTSGARKQGSLF